MKKLHLFIRAFFELAEAKPIAKISVEELCNEVGVKRQTFYYHFNDMSDFVKAVMIDFTEHREDIDGDFTSDARFVADIYSTYSNAVKNILNSLYASEVTDFLHDYLNKRSYHRVSSNPKYNNLPSEQLSSVSRIVAGILVSELSYWVKNNMQEDKEHLIERLRVIFLNIEKMKVENALRDKIRKSNQLGSEIEKTNKH